MKQPKHPGFSTDIQDCQHEDTTADIPAVVARVRYYPIAT